MKANLTKPLYQYTKKGFKINYEFNPKQYGMTLNCIGMSWLDHTYGLLKTLLLKGRNPIIITDSDLIAHNDYIDHISIQQIILVVTETPVSPSKKRMQAAYKKIKAAGRKVRLFNSLNEGLAYLIKQGAK